MLEASKISAELAVNRLLLTAKEDWCDPLAVLVRRRAMTATVTRAVLLVLCASPKIINAFDDILFESI